MSFLKKDFLFFQWFKVLFFVFTISSNAQMAPIGNKLIGSNSIGYSYMGGSVSISGDGKTAIAGGYMDNYYVGAAWIFTFDGTNFIQIGNKLVGSGYIDTTYHGDYGHPIPGDPDHLYGVEQGSDVSISDDGKTAVVAGHIDDGGSGAVWVYTYNGTNFVQAGNKLIGTGKTEHVVYQGSSVDISGDGKTIVFGAPNDSSGRGATWVFTFNGSSFVQFGNKLVGTNYAAPLSGQGTSVSVSTDGKTIVVGADGDNYFIGAAWVFTFNGTDFVQVGNKLVGTGYVDTPYQGNRVNISSDGKTIIVGGKVDNSYTGGAWIYTFNGSNFVQVGNRLLSTGSHGLYSQGAFVSLTSDGKTAFVSGTESDGDLNTAWIYTFNGSTFDLAESRLIHASRFSPFYIQGECWDITPDGKFIMLGDGTNNNYKGTARIFEPCITSSILGTSSDMTVCYGNQASVSVTISGSLLTYYQWYRSGLLLTGCTAPGIDINSVNTTTAGTYYCTIINACGTLYTQDIKIDFYPPFQVKGKVLPGSVCYGNPITITGSGAPIISITGSALINQSFVPLSSEIYTLTGMDTHGCFNTTTLNVTVNSLPTIEIAGNTTICQGSTITLTASGAWLYNWSDGTTTSDNSISPGINTQYLVTGTGQNGCSNTASAAISVNKLPDVSLDFSSINNQCDTLGSIPLSGGSPDGGAYWFNGNKVSAFNSSSVGNYVISYIYSDLNGCSNTASAILTIIHCTVPGICERPDPPCTCTNTCPPPPARFKIYTGLTPNGDGLNDTWYIDSLQSECKVTVLDKWGNEVYSTMSYNNTWDAKRNGEELPNGIYYYVVETSEKRRFSGTVSVIR